MPKCRCGNEFSRKRAALGYSTCFTCLECGEEDARLEKEKKSGRVTILCNKSSYQYICSQDDLWSLGRK
jgi:transcription elongation factor Elf1